MVDILDDLKSSTGHANGGQYCHDHRPMSSLAVACPKAPCIRFVQNESHATNLLSFSNFRKPDQEISNCQKTSRVDGCQLEPDIVVSGQSGAEHGAETGALLATTAHQDTATSPNNAETQVTQRGPFSILTNISNH